MSQNNETFNPFDPTGMFKSMRDANMDAWSKMMIQLVNTDAYAKATGAMLDAWLTTSAPFRKALETAMTQVLTNLNMPTRADVISLAERLTNIEMRLDDLEAKLDESLRAPPQGRRPEGQARPLRRTSHDAQPRRALADLRRRLRRAAEDRRERADVQPAADDRREDRPDAERGDLDAQQGQAVPLRPGRAGGASATSCRCSSSSRS